MLNADHTSKAKGGVVSMPKREFYIDIHRKAHARLRQIVSETQRLKHRRNALNLVVINGPVGCGKTKLAQRAVYLFRANKAIRRIRVITNDVFTQTLSSPRCKNALDLTRMTTTRGLDAPSVVLVVLDGWIETADTTHVTKFMTWIKMLQEQGPTLPTTLVVLVTCASLYETKTSKLRLLCTPQRAPSNTASLQNGKNKKKKKKTNNKQQFGTKRKTLTTTSASAALPPEPAKKNIDVIRLYPPPAYALERCVKAYAKMRNTRKYGALTPAETSRLIAQCDGDIRQLIFSVVEPLATVSKHVDVQGRGNIFKFVSTVYEGGAHIEDGDGEGDEASGDFGCLSLQERQRLCVEKSLCQLKSCNQEPTTRLISLIECNRALPCSKVFPDDDMDMKLLEYQSAMAESLSDIDVLYKYPTMVHAEHLTRAAAVHTANIELEPMYLRDGVKNVMPRTYVRRRFGSLPANFDAASIASNAIHFQKHRTKMAQDNAYNILFGETAPARPTEQKMVCIRTSRKKQAQHPRSQKTVSEPPPKKRPRKGPSLPPAPACDSGGEQECMEEKERQQEVNASTFTLSRRRKALYLEFVANVLTGPRENYANLNNMLQTVDPEDAERVFPKDIKEVSEKYYEWEKRQLELANESDLSGVSGVSSGSSSTPVSSSALFVPF